MAQERNKVRAKASGAKIDLASSGDALLLNVSGLVDEHFAGFGAVAPNVKTVVINTTGLTRMTSFGVRQWLEAMDALPKAISDIYLLGCPTFFVDQLNMVLNFGGAGKVLTTVAPYMCPACGHESTEIVDVLATRATLVKGGVPDRACSRCGEKLELDESPDSYFTFVHTYAASALHPEAAKLLAAQGLYTSLATATEKPPKILKLVQGDVTYFRLSGTIGARFRARPLTVGTEGEVVIDLAEVDRFDAAGQLEWRKLIKNLTTSVSAVTLMDVGRPVLEAAAEGLLRFDQSFAVSSVLVPYRCTGCDRCLNESVTAAVATAFKDRVCSACGGATKSEATPAFLSPLAHANFTVPAESAKLIRRRDEMLSRAIVDAKVADAGENSTPRIEDDSIFGKYKIVRKLSAGGMAEVFLAKQVGIGGFEKPVALKRIQRQLLERRHLAVDMFLNEAKIAARLMHPNIVQVLDVGESGGALYLAMEYVHGRDFHEMFKRLRNSRVRMPLAESCYIVREVALALHHAYWSVDIDGKQLSVVHRDISPHNVILGFDGAVKLLDFGVALSSVTESETMVVGKWMYMSPEHTTNKNVDHRSDLFSLGVILYQACTGKAPFASSNAKETVRKIREGDFVPVQHNAPEVPDRLADLIHRLLSPDPAHRPQHGQSLATELNEICRESELDVSAAEIAKLMSEVFPEDASQVVLAEMVETDPTKLMDSGQISRVTGQMSGSHSKTPSLSRVNLDFSVSLVANNDDQDDHADPVPKPSRASSVLVTVMEILGVLVVVAVLAYLVVWS